MKVKRPSRSEALPRPSATAPATESAPSVGRPNDVDAMARQGAARASAPTFAAGTTSGAPSALAVRATGRPSEVSPYLAFSQAPDALMALLQEETTRAFEFVQALKPAFTFFGGARVRPDDPFFTEGRVWGEAVALANVFVSRPEVLSVAASSGVFAPEAVAAAAAVSYGVAVGASGVQPLNRALASLGGASSPEAVAEALSTLEAERIDPASAQVLMSLTRTGAGPGMMEAVPVGVIDARAKVMKLFPELGAAALAHIKTQGANIILPNEAKASPHIEQREPFDHFLPRRLALTEQSAGFVVFPGGIGTLNELFEVLRLERPLALHSPEFWSDLIETIKAQWTARDLVRPEDLDNIQVFDGPVDALPFLAEKAATLPPPPAPSPERSAQLAGDLQRGIATLTRLPSAVTFVGGQRLSADDPEVAVARDLAHRMARSGVPARSGGAGALLDAVSEGVKASGRDLPVQALLQDSGQLDLSEIDSKADVYEVVHSGAAHKVLLTENTDAIVALPGGVSTMDEVFEVACLIQCEELPPRPIILVGSEFWQPILDAMKAVMLDDRDVPDAEKRNLISPEDMDLFSVVDDPAEAARIIRKHRAQRELEG